MAEGRRRVVRGIQDRLEKKPGEKSYVQVGYADQVDASNQDTLNNLQADNPDIQIASDQYHTPEDLASTKGTEYKSVQFAPGSQGGDSPSLHIEKLNTEPRAATNMFGQTKAQSYQAKRKQEIEDVMNKYQEATNQAGKNREMSALTSVPLALTNPAAAQLRYQGYEQSDNAPVKGIQGGRQDQKNYLGNQNAASDLADKDEESDPDSNISKMLAEQLDREFNIKVPPGTSARAIKKLFPTLKLDVNRDTTISEGTSNRRVKVEEGQANRSVKQSEGELNRKQSGENARTMAGANIQKGREANSTRLAIEGLNAESRQNDAVGKAAKRDLDDLRERSVLGLRFKDVTKKIPSAQDHRQAVEVFNSKQSINSTLAQAQQMLSENPRKLAFTPEGRLLNQKLIFATKLLNKGLLHEGVTNGKDMEYGLELVRGGDTTGFEQWLLQGGNKVIQEFLNMAGEYVDTALSGYGYEEGQPDYDLSEQAMSGARSTIGQSGRDRQMSPQDISNLAAAGTGGTGLNITPGPGARKLPPAKKKKLSTEDALKAMGF